MIKQIVIGVMCFMIGIGIDHAVASKRLERINTHVSKYVKQEQGSQDKCFAGIEQIIIGHSKNQY